MTSKTLIKTVVGLGTQNNPSFTPLHKPLFQARGTHVQKMMRHLFAGARTFCKF
jgi:hypothetical protein